MKKGKQVRTNFICEVKQVALTTMQCRKKENILRFQNKQLKFFRRVKTFRKETKQKAHK